MVDRVTIFPGQIPLETDLLQAEQFGMIGIGRLAEAMLGNTSIAGGFSFVPSSPASMSAVLGPGTVYMPENLEQSSWSSLPQDSRSIIKQGISLDSQSLTFIAPNTVSFSQVALLEVQYLDQDVGLVLRPYYNAANPASPFEGPGGAGSKDNTMRKGAVSVQIKYGNAAASGSQLAPSPDAGWLGLYTVTLAYGQTSITAGNIAPYNNGSSLIPTNLTKLPADVQSGKWLYVGTSTNVGNTFSVSPTPAFTARTIGMLIRAKMNAAPTGAAVLNDGIGNAPIVRRGNAACVGGEWNANDTVSLIWNGASWQIPGLTLSDLATAIWYIGSVTTGSATAMVTSLTPVPSAATLGINLRVPISTTNGLAPTLDFGFGPVPIVINATGAVLAGGEMPGGVSYVADLEYDGQHLRLLNPVQSNTTPLAFYVSPSGSDSNTGLKTSDAFATIQGAINNITARYVTGATITVNVAAGTYSGFLVSPSAIAGWVFNGASANTVLVQSSSTSINTGRGSIIVGSKVTLQNMSFSSVYENIEGLYGASLTLTNVGVQGGATTATGVAAYSNSVINMTQTLSISGTFSSLFAALNGQINVASTAYPPTSATLAIIGSTTVSGQFATATKLGVITFASSLITTTGAGLVTGARYFASTNAIIDTQTSGNASYLPGTTSGTTQSGGQYS